MVWYLFGDAGPFLFFGYNKNMSIEDLQNMAVYQADSGAIALRTDVQAETIWATQKQLAGVFGVDVRTVNEHIKNIIITDELHSDDSTIRNFRIVQKEGSREVNRDIQHYNLDMILSVGYRVNSKQATQFRRWATQTLKQHIVDGYTINQQRIGKNLENFLAAVSDVQTLSQALQAASSSDILELIKAFAHTWFSLGVYDTGALPQRGVTIMDVQIAADELYDDIQVLKQQLIGKNEATELFAQEKEQGALKGIIGNIFQASFGNDLYVTIEEKAAHLLYFMVKNHIFNDGNKRSGAFAFIWLLQKSGFPARQVHPDVLAVLTLMVAGSNPTDKEKVIGLILLLLQKNPDTQP